MWKKLFATTAKTRKAETVETTTTTVHQQVEVPIPVPEKAPAASPDPLASAVPINAVPLVVVSEEQIVVEESVAEVVPAAAEVTAAAEPSVLEPAESIVVSEPAAAPEPVVVAEPAAVSAPAPSPTTATYPIVPPSAAPVTTPPPPSIGRSVSLATIDLSPPAWSLLTAIRHHHSVIKSHLDKCVATANAMSQGLSLDMAASAEDVKTRFNAVAALIAAHYDAEIEFLFPVLEDAAPGVTADIRIKGEKEKEKLESLSTDFNRVLGLILSGDVKLPRRESDDFKGLVNKLRNFNLGFKFWMVGEEATFAVILDQIDMGIQEEIFTKVIQFSATVIVNQLVNQIYLASVSSSESSLPFILAVLSQDEKAKYLENKERILRK
ncbi:hypothetical protein HDU84_003184 [Entophlyctis sp. JEL0112]|nr:hypothetical protein HDU84_003184 [Entophlyctis sp. JEL0112]